MYSVNHTNWNTHVDKIIAKLSTACYVNKSVYIHNDISTFKIIYYA